MSALDLARQYMEELTECERRLHEEQRRLGLERRAIRHVMDMIAAGQPSYRVHEYCLAHTAENRL